jgi:hypothetical protein
MGDKVEEAGVLRGRVGEEEEEVMKGEETLVVEVVCGGVYRE